MLLSKIFNRTKDICQYCDNKALYNQPDDTGEIVSVCKKHFIMDVS